VPVVDRAAVVKELVEMKARIAQLESELGASNAERDANALRSAEGVAVGGGSSSSMMPAMQAAAPPPAAAPAPPEIGAQTTTKGEPFDGDWTWLNSNGHAVDSPMSTKYFTPEFRADANYILDYNHPHDDTMGGATESFRSDEWQLEQISIGGDIRINNVRGRILTMNGLFATTTPRNDASPSRGQWDLAGAYKYVSEAWGGYHWDVAHGLNVDAGIFVSYIGLFSYYNFDNWTYQPSFVSSNTPWFFNGLRIQYFPTKKLKIEPWIINGWQSYARANGKPGLGGQILWRPKPYLDFVFNNYGLGEDAVGFPGRSRVHADYSAQVKYYDKPTKLIDKAAFTVTGDAGCEYGGGPSSGPYDPHGYSPEMGTNSTYSGGVNCHNSKNGRPKQAFLGYMIYDRTWFKKDLYAILCCLRLTVLRLSLALRILPRTVGTAPRCTTAPSPSTICRASSSRSPWRKAIATPMCPTGAAVAASRLPAATTALHRSMPAPTVRPPARLTATFKLRQISALAWPVVRIQSLLSGGPICAPIKPTRRLRSRSDSDESV